ncbi:HipA family kinase [Pseudooceanicola nitratireducens]|uniref:HipA family kinase n=1 Tax=Pseudooceanicola nitratireducens TaxID=517719 RepID=UPI002ADE581F|nr:HipA family kinase [Pseudooceanicola nitratireducens]
MRSINSLFRGQVQLEDGSVQPCLLKNIDRIEVVNELISNLIAARLGLPVPRAVLTFVPDEFNGKNQFSKAHKIKGGVVVFSSVDVQTPNLAQRVSSAHPLGQKIISHALNAWAKKSGLYGFDTWVANVDRHAGNLLFGSRNEVWLVDHGRCFTKEDWSPHDLRPNIQYLNRLREWYTQIMDPATRSATVSELPTVQGTIGALNVGSILTDSLASGLTDAGEQDALRDFLTTRVSRITTDATAALQP